MTQSHEAGLPTTNAEPVEKAGEGKVYIVVVRETNEYVAAFHNAQDIRSLLFSDYFRVLEEPLR